MIDLTLPRLARFIIAPSGAGKTTWLKKTGLAVDGDDVIAAVLTWRRVRGKLVIGDAIDTDISTLHREKMAHTLWTFAQETQAVVAFNGAMLKYEGASCFAFVEPIRHVAIRWKAARDGLTKEAATASYDRNIEANRVMAAELGGRIFPSFDAASMWLDTEMLVHIARHTRRVSAALRRKT